MLAHSWLLICIGHAPTCDIGNGSVCDIDHASICDVDHTSVCDIDHDSVCDIDHDSTCDIGHDFGPQILLPVCVIWGFLASSVYLRAVILHKSTRTLLDFLGST